MLELEDLALRIGNTCLAGIAFRNPVVRHLTPRGKLRDKPNDRPRLFVFR